MNLHEFPIGQKTTIPKIDFKELGQKCNLFPLFYWVSRDRTKKILAIGMHKKLTFSELAKSPQTVVGGMRFQRGEVASEWSNFGQDLFFVPKILFKEENGKQTLTLNDKDFEDIFTEKTNSPSPAKKNEMLIPSNEDFLARFESSIEKMKQDDVEKIVLARKKVINFDRAISPWEIFNKVELNNNNYSLLFQADKEHSFISFSPEQLFGVNGQVISCDSMAGTGLREESDEVLTQNLRVGHEQQVVTDDISRKLQSHCSSINHEKRKVLSLSSNLKHLYTKISGRLLPNSSSDKLISTLHPTAAVGGVPWQQAKAIISKHEQFDRGYYAAPCGIIESDNIDLMVAIRCALVEKNNVHLYAGAGIMQSSQGEQEWNEMENKMKLFSQKI